MRGCITGFAIGNALGLGTVYMTGSEVKRRYPEGLRSFDQIIRDAHRAMYEPGQWTSETEVMLRMSELLVQNGGKISALEIARALQSWYQSGRLDVSATFRMLLNHPNYATDPKSVARSFWNINSVKTETNEFLGPQLLIGAMIETNMSEIGAEAISVIHQGPRVQGAAAILSIVAHQLIWHERTMSPEEVLKLAEEYSDDLTPFIELAQKGGEELFAKLGEEHCPSDVRKALAATLWALWHASTPEQGIVAIVNAGGDSDVNAALAGGILGLKFGLEALPEVWLNTLIDKEMLRTRAIAFANALPQHVATRKHTGQAS